MSEYRLVVIGAGPGGYTAALRAAKLGMKTAVIEKREAGGTCLNRGCVPTKTLLHAAESVRQLREGGRFGVHAEGIRVDLPAVFAYKNEITKTLSEGIEGLLRRAKIPLIRGEAMITAPGEVTVKDAEGQESLITADNILIATGSVPARPPIPGLDLPGVLTSDDILEGTEEPYPSLLIIGGGVIGVEIAAFYAELGTKVTILEGLDRLLPQMDRELGQNLAAVFKQQGIEIHTGTPVQRLEQTDEGLKVSFLEKGEEKSCTAQNVLCAIGRSPFTAGLFAEGMQPEMDGRRIKVDENFATSLPGVWAIGDVSARIQLAHVAAAQGTACVERMCGAEPLTDLAAVPACIYTRPEIGAVGLTEAEAKEREIPVKTAKCVMGANARTMIAAPGRSFMKVVVHAETREILGAALMCEHATDMISEITEAVVNHLTVEQMLRVMRPHPTFEEALHEALESAAEKLG